MTAARGRGYIAAAVFVAAIVLANVLTTRYGFVEVGLDLEATAGTFAAGLALGVRDLIGDRRLMLAAVTIGALLSFAFADGRIALASFVAVLVSELADWQVYERVTAWPTAVLASNVVGAVVDTFLFLLIAGFFTWDAVPGQLVGKVVWATLVPLGLIYAVRSARAVHGDRLRPEGA